MKTALTFRDLLGTARARIGIDRNGYKINPGLYCVGNPTTESPVLVTANYKLSLDALRRELSGIDAWLLVVDTRGINVWCAAGRGTFSAEEIALQVQRAHLTDIVSHRELILPQFAAVGVASHKLKKLCGFKTLYGPLKARDIPGFLNNDKQADEAMRAVTFTMAERLVLVPVEIALIWKPFAIAVVACFLLSGIGPNIFSIDLALTRGIEGVLASILAVLAGAMATPALLPWIPGRQFWLKGALSGAVAGLIFLFIDDLAGSSHLEQAGLLIWIIVASSYMAMNYTGATPFTSLSGVEKEMRRGLPIQCLGVMIALALWIAAPFTS